MKIFLRTTRAAGLAVFATMGTCLLGLPSEASAVPLGRPQELDTSQAAAHRDEDRYPDYYARLFQPFFYDRVMTKCIQITFVDKTPFELAISVDGNGRVMRIENYPDTQVSKCLATELVNAEFPKPPTSSFVGYFQLRFAQ